MTHWEASCFINRLLGGRSDQPLCSRVYSSKPSPFRSAFLFCLDLSFGEYQHCKNIHNRYKGKGND